MRTTPAATLKKAKVRMSMCKHNLYNLSRFQLPSFRALNFFQSKWKAKSALRDYHGEHVREGQWQRMFSRRLRSVVPMNPAYLALNDGSLESAGRGSGLAVDPKHKKKKDRDNENIPYMQMTFAPLERRLDIAIFRALFASSARQARQFVVHGAVKVNGKPMRYPGYLLNPGDMFQVDPERVLFAMGTPKETLETAVDENVDDAEADSESKEMKSPPEPDTFEEVDIDREPRQVLQDLLSQSKSILASPRENIGAKRKQDLRSFSQAVQRLLSRSQSSTILTESLEAQFLELQNQLKIQKQNKKDGRARPASEQKDFEENVTEVDENAQMDPKMEELYMNALTDSEYNELYAALTTMKENPVDESKPYATPWMPRDYMSAFAFIPRYLEVNQNICAAVYLRHPVAKPGYAEVPTPFDEGTSESGFVWYLRRR